MKKLISFTLSLIMLVSSLCLTGFNAYASEYNGFKYHIDGSDVVIDSYEGTSDYVEIPHTIYGNDVTKIGDNAFMRNTVVTDVVFPSSIKEIGDMAFLDCPYIVSVKLPANLEKIGSYAFVQCDKLKYVNFGSKVSGVDVNTYHGCSGLLGFTVSEDNPNYSSVNGVLFNKDKTELIRYPSGSDAAKYTVPDGVKTIKENAFYNADELLSIVFPSSVECIETDAFTGTKAISDIYVCKSEEEWNKVSVGTQQDSKLLTAEYHYNYSPKPCEIHTKSGEGKVIKQPTCTEKGATEYVCAVCSETFTEETEPLGHIEEKIPAVLPTCKDSGLTEGVKCSRCGKILIEQKTVEPLGHTPEKLKRVAPTYFEKGKSEGEKCAVCGKILTPQKSIAKLVLAVPSKKKATAKKNGFVFTWKKNGNATGYIIQYSTKKDFSSKKTLKVTKNSTVKKTVKKLKAKKRYYIRIRAYKKSGNKTAYSKWSVTVKVKTK